MHLLRPLWKNIIVERARREGQPLSLFTKRLHELRMTMPLIDCTVRRETVDILLSFRVPDGAPTRTCEHDRQGVVVVRGVFMLDVDCGGGRGGVVLGLCESARRGLKDGSGGFQRAAVGIVRVVCVGRHGFFLSRRLFVVVYYFYLEYCRYEVGDVVEDAGMCSS